MSKVKLRNNRKLNRTNSKKTCKDTPQVRKPDLEQQQAEWAEAKWVVQKCQLRVHRQSKRVEELIGEKLLVCCQLVKRTQNKSKPEPSFGADLITTVTGMFHWLRHKKVSEM